MEVQYLHFSTLESTNDWAKAHIETLDKNVLTAITADIQTKGRGRLKRPWVSKKGNLHLTLFLCLKHANSLIPNLAQLLAYAAAQVLLKQGIPVAIKWPNDLLVHGKKISGALVETITLDNSIGIIMGIGMNVNTPVEADQPATSLVEITGHPWNLKEIRDEIINHFLTALETPFPLLIPQFEALLAFKGERVRCDWKGGKTEGMLLGIDSSGGLKIEKDHQILVIHSGDIEHLRSI